MKSGILENPPTNGSDIDRISELPDSVLHHILSFLETKLTVQTSILSKRWTHLWASVPALDFTDQSFRRRNGNFENFVDTVLLLRDASDLRSFSLCLYDYFDEGHVHRWIRHAAKYNPKVLQIEFPVGVICLLPLGILPFRSLEELSMTLDYSVELGPPKIMGRLRRLHIQWASGEYGLMGNLVSSCPVLEDLDMHNCELDSLCISSNTLKRLSIKDCRIRGNKNLISTPSLVCLTYTDKNGCTTLKNLSPLLNATVHTSDDLIGLGRGLANVETLNFSFLEEEDYQEFSISKFGFSLTMKSGILEHPPTNGSYRISELPDSVLHHILSFLETKYSVQTSILSKRWTHLWASVPALDITDESFIRNGEDKLNASDKHSFENFVDTVLLLRDASDLRSFSLCLYDYFDEGHVHRWIRHAAKYNPKVLQIEFPVGVICRLPLGILPFQSLEELSMTLDYSVELGPPKIMGCLRRLRIQWAFGKNGLMENLVSSCPVLEDLDLHNCVLDSLCISSNTLKRLSIKDCKIRGNENSISTPSLVCLTYTDNSGCTTLKNLSPLLIATVYTSEYLIGLGKGLANVETLNFSFLEEEDYQENENRAYMMKKFRKCNRNTLGHGLYQSKQAILRIEVQSQDKLPEDLSQFPIFDNLRSLTLVGQCTSDMIQVVALFLQHSPNLQRLTLINRGVSPLSLSGWKVIQKSAKLSFRCPHLQLIEIRCHRSEEKLHELIKYLLLNAIGVPKIVITWGWRWKYF